MKYYLTTPIYYVNDVPHIGHAYTTVAADVLARWRRLRGDEVFFLTGTDEHGAKICQAAEKNGRSPRAFCDGIVQSFRDAWSAMRITNDRFIRTTDPRHEKAVQVFLQKLYDNGMIYKSKYEGTYCVQCEKFLSEDDLNEDGCCPDHRTKPVHHAEENYFFKLSAYRDTLIDMLSDEKNPRHIAVLPAERRNEILGKLRTGLEDISISRAALAWGIPLPFDASQTVYVWVDALLNYISAIGYEDNPAEFSRYWPCELHLMAKDILWFHSVIWPAMLLAAELPVPKKLFAHGFFTINGQKMSKTIGNVILPDQIVGKFGTDASRYLTLALFPFGVDGDISWAGMTERYNTDLANNLGNLVSRTLAMVDKYFGGTLPSRTGTAPFSVTGTLAAIPPLYDSLEFSRIIETIQKAVDSANRHIEEKAPWKMAKAQDPALADVLYDLAESIGLLSFYLLPFLPETCEGIWGRIGGTGPLTDAASRYLASGDLSSVSGFPRAGAKTAKGANLFPRIEKK